MKKKCIEQGSILIPFLKIYLNFFVYIIVIIIIIILLYRVLFELFSKYRPKIDSNFLFKIYFNSLCFYIKYFCFVPTFRKSGIFGIFIGEGIEESCEKKSVSIKDRF